MKTCSKCLQTKEDKEFYIRRDTAKPRLQSHCLACIKVSKKKNYEKVKHTVDARWAYTKSACKKKGAGVFITKEQYAELIAKPCYYCNSDLSNEIGIGLDRIDNSQYYSIDNVLPCCGRCNIGRQDLFTSSEWKIMIDALIKSKCDVPVSGL